MNTDKDASSGRLFFCTFTASVFSQSGLTVSQTCSRAAGAVVASSARPSLLEPPPLHRWTATQTSQAPPLGCRTKCEKKIV